MSLPFGLDAKSVIAGAVLVAVVIPFVTSKLAAHKAG